MAFPFMDPAVARPRKGGSHYYREEGDLQSPEEKETAQDPKLLPGATFPYSEYGAPGRSAGDPFGRVPPEEYRAHPEDFPWKKKATVNWYLQPTKKKSSVNWYLQAMDSFSIYESSYDQDVESEMGEYYRREKGEDLPEYLKLERFMDKHPDNWFFEKPPADIPEGELSFFLRESPSGRVPKGRTAVVVGFGRMMIRVRNDLAAAKSKMSEYANDPNFLRELGKFLLVYVKFMGEYVEFFKKGGFDMPQSEAQYYYDLLKGLDSDWKILREESDVISQGVYG